MIQTNPMKWLRILLLSSVLAACLDIGPQADGGIGGTGITQGPITALGSIVVNGIHFTVGRAAIHIDGQTAAEDLLQPGMVVTVYGAITSDGSGTATRVTFDYNLKGVIAAIQRDGTGFSAHGQNVRVDALTVWQGITFSELTLGAAIYVSGIPGPDGMLLARYVSNQAVMGNLLGASSIEAALPSQGWVTVSGAVAELIPQRRSFILGRQVVDYATALFVDMTEAQLINGAALKLTGYQQAGVLIATQIEPLPLVENMRAGQFIKIQGLVSAGHEAGRFKIATQTIRFGADTEFVAGDAGDLAANVLLTVTGIWENDAVIAQRIEFQPTSLIRIAAPIEAIQDDELILAGKAVRILNTTLMLDNSALALRYFAAGDLRIGDALIVYGYKTASGIALERLERVDHLD